MVERCWFGDAVRKMFDKGWMRRELEKLEKEAEREREAERIERLRPKRR